MKIAVISDIHANYEALKAVMDDIKTLGIKHIYCLGDMIGYGPQPEEVVQYIKKNNIPSVYGNHEAALWNNRIYESMNSSAQISFLLNRNYLSKESKNWLHSLTHNIIEKDFLFVHGTPPNSFQKYLLKNTPEELLAMFQSLPFKIAFCGHTHLLRVISMHKNKIEQLIPEKGKTSLNPNSRYIINAGSVGQPRDDNKDAKYIIYNPKEPSIEVRFIKYQVKKTIQLLQQYEYPEINSVRLL
ncbi:MAG: metallophosphatase family protein [Bacteroidales bacterium]|nr:metallophosphatase family protein [Bacteroidales bacterium]